LLRMQTAAKLKAEYPKMSKPEIMLQLGYSTATAAQGKATFWDTPQFDYWVKIYSGLEHVKNITGLADVVALDPIFKGYLKEAINRLTDEEQMSRLSMREITSTLTKIAEITAKATSTMSEETKKAVTDLLEAETSFKKYLPEGYSINEELIN